MSWNLKKTVALFAVGFCILCVVGIFTIWNTPSKEFIGQTSPDQFSFQFKSPPNSITTTMLSDDHVLLCYVQQGEIYSIESSPRGAAWQSPVFLTNTYTSGAADLFAKTVMGANGLEVLVAWDANVPVGSGTLRRALFIVIDAANLTVCQAPSLFSKDSDNFQEACPSIDGNSTRGYVMASLVKNNGTQFIHLQRSTDLNTWTPFANVTQGTATLSLPTVLMNATGGFNLVYQFQNSTMQAIATRSISPGWNTSAETIIYRNSTSDESFQATCFTLDAEDGIVASLQQVNGSVAISIPTIQGLPTKQSAIIASGNASVLHAIFSNYQVLSVWIEPAVTTTWFTITDFNMNDRNSAFYSALVSYIFIACGLFNLQVYFYLKRRNDFDEESEPANNLFVTVAFIVLGALIALPYTGFQGESLGKSTVGEFLLPAPISNGTFIVIGFVFAFFFVSTPLIDRFWRRGARAQQDRSMIVEETKPFSWKQEVVRKIPHMGLALLIVGFYPVGSDLMRFVGFWKYSQFNFYNEGGIIIDYVLRLNNLEIASYAVKLFCASGVIFLWVLDLHMVLTPNKYFFLKDYLRFSFRKKEKSSIADSTVMLVAVFLLLVVLSYNPAYKIQAYYVSMACIGVLCFGDTSAVIVGKSMGRHKLYHGGKKTWEGAITGTVVSFIVVSFFLTWPFSLLMAGIYLFVDIVTPRIKISDNILIPLVIIAVFFFLLPWVQSPLAFLYVNP
jgi:dolichol kinase